MKPTADTIHPIHTLLQKRWSPRAFAERPLEAGQTERLLEAARWSASCFNEQPWRFIAGEQGTEKYEKLFDCLAAPNQTWAGKAPLLIAGLAKKTFTHNDKPNRHAVYDLGQAMAQLTVQASHEGLFVHQMAGFDPEKLRESFGVSDDFDIVVVAAIGHLGEASDLPEALAGKEEAPQVRKDMKDLLL